MNDKRKAKYIIGAMFPIIILISMTFLPLYTIFFGEEIFLETRPYDPRDLFMGDYVRLDYDINEVDMDKFPNELKEQVDYRKYINKKIYAVLKKEGDYHIVDYMTFTKPKNRLFLTARLGYFPQIMFPDSNRRKVHVNFNLDKYFVPENTGRELEEMSRRGELTARVKVSNGYAVLVEIFEKR